MNNILTLYFKYFLFVFNNLSFNKKILRIFAKKLSFIRFFIVNGVFYTENLNLAKGNLPFL